MTSMSGIKTPDKARHKRKLSHQSHTCLFQPGITGHSMKNIFDMVEDPIEEQKDEDEVTVMSNVDPKERSTRVQDSLSGYEAGGSVQKNHSSDQISMQIKQASKAVNSFEGRNLLETMTM